MGMMACYNQVSGEQLNLMFNMNSDELFETVEEIQEEDPNACDLDQCWDVLHFVLTGVSACEPIENNLLSEAIVGTKEFVEDGDFIAYIQPERVREIDAALAEVDFDSLLENISPGKLEENDIDPSELWFEDKDSVHEILTETFDDLKGFYAFAAENTSAVVVSIY